ncbi:hypothetical protein XENORESO_006608 [Xenotaenia resolanae]|uniref:Uncharacterized protein n=1 Tax=Xenotaenia resolanae TaxID=208358 RepID=A0ABV0WET8_9TELE
MSVIIMSVICFQQRMEHVGSGGCRCTEGALDDCNVYKENVLCLESGQPPLDVSNCCTLFLKRVDQTKYKEECIKEKNKWFPKTFKSSSCCVRRLTGHITGASAEGEAV